MTVQNIKSKALLTAESITKKEQQIIGGKAKHLHLLQQLGLNVPKWVVLPYTKTAVLTGASLNHFLNDISEEVQAYFGADKKFAVRSSAIQEDGINHSFAGQFHTELNVDVEDLPGAIIKVLNSVESDHIISYCKQKNIGGKLNMSVIIQEMINPEISGVAFGINPVNGNRNEKIASAVFGLGEGLVSGELNADHFVIGQEMKKTIVQKEKARVSTEQGTELIDLPKRKQFQITLDDAKIKQINNCLDLLKDAFGKAQDIEFGFIEDDFILFQSRPITGLDKLADKSGELIIWDNSNIVESYPGVSSPLTFSFILKVYEGAYKQISKIFGVSQKTIDTKSEIYENLLGSIRGRVYYNLKNWYRMLAQLPGFKLNAGFMEGMMGVKESFTLEKEEKSMGKFEAWMRVIFSIIKMIWQLIKLPKSRIQFHNLMDASISKYEAIDFDQCDAAELMKHYQKFEGILLKEWKAPLVNDLYAMIFFGLLQKMSKKYFPDNPSIGNQLVAESGDIISTKPAKRLLKISSLIQEDPIAKSLFIDHNSEIIWQRLEEFPMIQKEIEDYIAAFGDRCTGELKLETITYKQDPTQLIHIIKNYVKQEIKQKKRTTEAKVDSEKIVKQRLKKNPFKFMLFNYVLNKSRSMISGRENLRFERTRAFAMVRNIFIAIGKQWYAEGIIADPRDIFLLEQKEIFDFIKGTSCNSNLIHLVENRKTMQETFQSEEAPSERIKTYGTVYHANNFYDSTQEKITEGDISGIACCAGVVKGKVQVIHDPSEIDSLEGDILVTTSTDPGWVALFPTASAILVERGSLLSHSAIVAREMSIPCIVGISNLLKRLKTGDLIEMDGSTGLVKILN